MTAALTGALFGRLRPLSSSSIVILLVGLRRLSVPLRALPLTGRVVTWLLSVQLGARIRGAPPSGDPPLTLWLRPGGNLPARWSGLRPSLTA